MDEGCATTPGNATVAAGPDGRETCRVLVVEDNVGFAYLLRDVLVRQSDGNFVLDEARDLASALDRLRHRKFDVILLDLGLPDSGGYGTFSRVRRAAAETAIIILTVLDDDEVAMDALRGGAQDYLVKDQVDKQLLARAIRYAMTRARIECALRHLSCRLLQIQDEERRRIARELHDVTAQSLAALSMNLSTLKTVWNRDPGRAARLVDESFGFVQECAREIRTMSYLLHPPLLDELGLAGTVRDYADGFAERSRVRVDLEIDGDVDRLPRETETALFRVMQEALSNIHRHSGSRTASVRLLRSDGHVDLEVRDTGAGIPPERLQGRIEAGAPVGVGIAGMRERMRQLGGTLAIESSEAGTKVIARMAVGENRHD